MTSSASQPHKRRTGSQHGNTPHRDAPHVDTQSLGDPGTYIYEAIATLEYAGRQPSRTAIAAAAELDDELLDQTLRELTARGLLTMRASDGESVYEPASRDWSTQPGQAAGHPMS